MSSVYIALLHYPVLNRYGKCVVSSVTNMDIHDISRTAKTYGVKGFFLVTPLQDQHETVHRILNYWKSDALKEHHPDRYEAISLVELASTFEDVKKTLFNKHGQWPEVFLTDARRLPKSESYIQVRQELKLLNQNETRPIVIVFGTGWGVSEVFYPEVSRFLEPIFGPSGEGGYNHLSVRAAVATICDRLFGC